MSRVLFAGGGTGGHLYPALALAAALRRERPATEVHFVGALRGVEARVLPAEKQPHTLLPFEPLRRSRVWENWKLVPAIVRSSAGLSRLFRTYRPRLVVGTGGYASAPACAWALMRGVPIAVQEQNSWPGLTTRVMSRWARQVHLGFPEARRLLKPGKRTVVTALGNPIAPPDAALDRLQCRERFGLSADATVVLVVGGSQGARAINEALLEAVSSGLQPGVEILWATGPSHYESIKARLAQMPKLGGVIPIPYIIEMPKALASADVAISRAGAMATAELLAWGVPALLIPFPFAAADHQTHNARALAEAGAALMLVERDLSGERLRQELERLTADVDLRSRVSRAARERARPNAARDIARELITLLDE
ncbi:MAG TPA: undecaprenyldiphospho-muramoylpentapeptide beta-N-acetylglucosaminyltransferase [Longimicrobiales bacterium]|nr:undecaprenyldiphospho-muramoylpentapeptide beta-N-acetylglucosaminyltransferase [Longimicrobiales bacterium]